MEPEGGAMETLDISSNYLLQEDEELEKEEEEEGEVVKLPIRTSFRPKLVEILKSLHSSEVQIYSEASKEFISLLKGDMGGDILCEYIQLSPKCSELLESWKLHQGNPGMSHILSLVAVIFDHPEGKRWSSGIVRNIDNFARIVFKERLDDIYTELKSQESRRQNAALYVLAYTVKRGMSLASEVAKGFDFKIPILSKLSGIQKKKKGGGKEAKQGRRRCSTRKAFVRFALSFIQVGNPRLLRWILQQREMYSGVLRGLGDDDIETIVYVLSTIRDKVLTEDSLIPPGLRSVLFGSVTLEQLGNISANRMAGPAADLAHEILVMVCTDPCNGLMPGLNLKGNEKRLLELMKTLKATEVGYHKDLLLSIARRLSLCSAYMDEFPYHLEPRSSSLWFSAISLAADIVSSTNVDAAIVSLSSHSHNLSVMIDGELQSILKCILPRAFTRSVINKGLLHSDILVRHGSLRLLLESLKSLAGLIRAIDDMAERSGKQKVDSSTEGIAKLHGLSGYSCFVDADDCLAPRGVSCSPTDEQKMSKWVSLKLYLQDEVRAALPDPQVLLKLLSSLGYKHSNPLMSGLKRCATDLPEVMKKLKSKKLKSDATAKDFDIVISGVDTDIPNNTASEWESARAETSNQELDMEKDHRRIIAEIWGLNGDTMISDEPSSAENFFHSKLLDAITFYLRTVPIAFEGSFDFFKILPLDPLSLSNDRLQSLLSLLVEYVGQTPGGRASARAPDLMYKHLQPLLNILVYSKVKGIRDQAYCLARAAMISSGAFDQNLSEIDAWFFFLPGCYTKSYNVDYREAETFRDLSAVVLSFLCDAVSTVGNNLYKYMDHMRKLISKLDNAGDHTPVFSPLIVCILQKCIRLLESESGTFKLYERSMVSLYVCNTLSLFLQTQVDMGTLSSLIHMILTEKLEFSLRNEGPKSSLCEWRPLKNLQCFAWRVFDESCDLVPISESIIKRNNSSFSLILAKMKEFLGREHDVRLVGVSNAFTSSLICATPDDMLTNFPLLLTAVEQHFKCHFPFLTFILFLDHNFLANVASMWPDMFFSGFEMIEGMVSALRDKNGHVLSSDEVPRSTETSVSTDLGSMESPSVAAAFGLFLYHAPFYALFPAVLNLGSCNSHSIRILDVLRSNTVLNLIQFKLSEGSLDDFSSYLGNVLFWTYQTLLSYKTKPLNALEELIRICVNLVGYILDRILVRIANTNGLSTAGSASVTQYAQQIVDLIFHHPVVAMFLSQPLCFSRNLTKETLEDYFQDFDTSSRQIFHQVDHHILQLLKKVFDFLVAVGNCRCSPEFHVTFPGLVLSAPKNLVRMSVLVFREKFELSIIEGDVRQLFPSFYIFHTLMQFVSPFELLELVHWMFCTLKISISSSTSFINAVSVSLNIAIGALDMLFSYIQQPSLRSGYTLFCDWKARSFDAGILPKLYEDIIEFAIRFDLEVADVCLLKIVNTVHCQRFAKPHPSLLPLHTLLCRMVINSPMQMLVHCFCPPSKIKAKILLLLTEVSPVHMSLFGQTFLSILKKDLSVLEFWTKGTVCPLMDKMMSKNTFCDLSEDDFVLLLPVALSFSMSSGQKYVKQDPEPLTMIPNFYSGILLNGFTNWKNYVSRDIFQEDYDDFSPTTLEDFQRICSSSLVGKAVLMLDYFFKHGGSPVKKHKQWLKIFDAIYPDSSLFDNLSESELKKLGSCSYKKSLRIIDAVAAKISFTRLLLFPPESATQSLAMQVDVESKGLSMERESKKLDSAKLKFVTILVNTLDQITRIFPLKVDHPDKSCDARYYRAFKFLERAILRNIVQLSMEIQSYLAELPSIPFLHQFIRSSFLHRFQDPLTLKAIRCILVALSGTRFSSAEILALLVGHSQFVPTVLHNHAMSSSSTFAPGGSLLQPVPSVLKSLGISCIDQIASEVISSRDMCSKLRDKHSSEGIKLELIKLLRILYYLKDSQHSVGNVNVDGMNSRELLSLLLAGYGATLSQTDLEIFHLMREIESTERSDCGSIAEMDYLWGVSALKVRKERNLDGLVPSSLTDECESIEERRRVLFRENIPIDSKLSVMTVLHFCNDRSSRTASMSLNRLQQDSFVDALEQIPSSNFNVVQQYDPAFILRFSIHILLMGYLEPMEFSRLGLLAITFASISSPDGEMRKLGYDCLGKFKKVLENHGNSKDVLQLQLLLTYLQNGIMEKWQRIPFVIAVFAAEASLIMLDPSQNLFYAISKFLMDSHGLSLKRIPLLQKLFKNHSIHFKTERLWVLRLLYAGLNSNIDARLFMTNNLFELMLSLYASSLSDPESKVLIIQIMKKCVKLLTIAHDLIKECGLISWLSSVISFYANRLSGDHDQFSLEVMDLVLKAINDGISSRMISEWLQEYALEQLSELASHLHALIVSSIKLLKGNMSLVNSILTVMAATLKISHKRKVYQPHFTLSLEGLFQLHQAINAEFSNMEKSDTIELGLNVILMCAPIPVASYVDKIRVSKLLTFAIPAALGSISKERYLSKDPHPDLHVSFMEQQREESLVSKLLRWVIASIILGSISNKSSKVYSCISIKRSTLGSLQPLIEEMTQRSREIGEKDSGSNDALAVLVLYLQQFLGRNCVFLRSVVLALCLLLLEDSHHRGREFLDENYILIASLCSKIRCPPEVNSSWRWSYYQPWEDRSFEQSELEQMGEEHACRSLLIIFSNALQGGKSLGSQALSVHDLENSGLFEWERDTFLGSRT